MTPSMQAQCPHCSKSIEYRDEPPRFCAFCGKPLIDPGARPVDATITYDSSHTRDSSPPVRDTSAPIPLPSDFAGYRLVRKLGDGGMGTVFEAEDHRYDRRVALKMLSPRVDPNGDALERFRLEGRLASTITHPRCVFVLAADEAEGVPYIVMELMPGTTLQNLVDQAGALPMEEAVERVLDVIEGLEAAHSVGVIHRDVKPSNCFLTDDGRVKVGDFGLSKSLSNDSHLTRTGSFLGTPLYASPEQIRGEEIDERTDVYSVAATLYFLLTGRAPHQGGDAAAVLAKIVSEPAPPALRSRAELPATLDRVLMRALDRDRERRQRDLGELRDALLAFAPQPAPSAELAARTLALLIDVVVVSLAELPLQFLDLSPIAIIAAACSLWLAYFFIQERFWGATIGKRVLGLRVNQAEGKDRPGSLATLIRTLAFIGITQLPLAVSTEMVDQWIASRPAQPISVIVGMGVILACGLGSSLVLLSTMRPSNGFRGPHEWLSGTRVVRLPSRVRRRAPLNRRRGLVRERGSGVKPIGVLSQVGPYKVRGAIRWEGDYRLLAAEDSTLGREVWVMMRRPGAAPIPPARRELNRPTRLRWISGGEQSEGRWDAFVAPAGCPLADLAGPEGLSWAETYPILLDLADELNQSCNDGTLPATLSVDQVWVEPDGRMILVDPLGGSDESPSSLGARDSADSRAAAPADRARALLRTSAAVALEGGRRLLRDSRTRVRAAVPIPARKVLDRLYLDSPDGYEDMSGVHADLVALKDRPTELTLSSRMLRAGSLVVSVYLRILAALLVVELLALAGFQLIGWRYLVSIAGQFTSLATLALLGSALWCLLTGGGFAPRLIHNAVVRSDGRKAGRWRSAWREIVLWLPIVAIAAIVEAAFLSHSADAWLGPALAIGILSWLATIALVELFRPGRMLHDLLAGTRWVPA